MKYQAYTKYRPSRLEWLDIIPEHWDVTRLKLLSRRYSGGTPSKDKNEYWQDGTIPWLNSGSVNQGTITRPSTYITELGLVESSAKWIPEESIIIALAGQGKTKGKAAYTTFKTTCNQSMGVVVFEKDHPRFMYWWLTSQYRNIRGMASDDGRDGLNLEMIGTIPCPLPSIEEQRQIATFLDYKTEQIDLLIKKKKELIKKLEEKRFAVITRAVTFGLEQNVELKTSTKDWLSFIPKNWEVSPLKWLSKRYSGGTPDKSKSEYWIDGTIPWLNSGTVNQGDVDTPSAFITEEAFHNSSAKWIPSGAIVIALAGQGKTKGAAAYMTIKATCNQSMAVIVFDEKHYSRFMYWWLVSQYRNIRGLASEDGRDGLNLEMIGSIPCPIPPYNEQLLITNFIDDFEQKRKNILSKLESAITTLELYRSTVIFSAVTGKIDVRKIDLSREAI
jgi:type I restriction enzyme S subunit